MKHFVLTSVALLALMGPVSIVSNRELCAAGDNECEKAFGHNVSSCAQSIDLQLLPPKERSEALKACVESARTAREACISGVNQCVNICQASYDSGALSCEQSFDPSNCGGEPFCIAIVEQQREQCLSIA